MKVSLAIMTPLGTIHILRQHMFGLFWTHPLYQHKYCTKRLQKEPISEPLHPFHMLT